MITNLQKRDGRFERLNISVDNLPEVDLIIKWIRGAQDNNNVSFTDNEELITNNILEECEYIAKVKQY